MARPKMTDAHKTAAKVEREAKKADAVAGAAGKADKAETRANSNKPVAAPRPSLLTNSDDLDREEKVLFLQWMPKIKAAKEALATASSSIRNLYKEAKSEGSFTKSDFETAFALETAEKEACERGLIARKLKIAKMVGSGLGNQLDLFSAPDRTPLADRAFHEGETDAMQNIPARPSYDPSTEGHRRYLDGFHSVSEKRIKEGMGTLQPDTDEIEQQKADRKTAQGRYDEAFADYDMEAAAPSSGVSMTRSQFKAHLGTQAKDGTKH